VSVVLPVDVSIATKLMIKILVATASGPKSEASCQRSLGKKVVGGNAALLRLGDAARILASRSFTIGRGCLNARFL
jgi:hypothetical protein